MRLMPSGRAAIQHTLFCERPGCGLRAKWRRRDRLSGRWLRSRRHRLHAGHHRRPPLVLGPAAPGPPRGGARGVRSSVDARQARDGSLGSGPRGAIARDLDGRHPGRHGRGWIGTRGALVGRQRDGYRAALRGDVPGALCRPRALRPEDHGDPLSRIPVGHECRRVAEASRGHPSPLGVAELLRGACPRMGARGCRRPGFRRLVRRAHAPQPEPRGRP